MGTDLVVVDSSSVLAQKFLSGLPLDTLFFKVTLPVVSAYSSEGAMWLSVEASGPEQNTLGSRMSEAALQKMLFYIERGWNGQRIPYLDGHHRDLLAAELGEVYGPRLTDEKHLAINVLLDDENPQSVRLYKAILKGKKHGASIAGFVHSRQTVQLPDGTQDTIVDDIEVIEVSRTSYPSWRGPFTTMLLQNAHPLCEAAPLAFSFIERRFSAFGDTPGLLSCQPAGDGTWLCKAPHLSSGSAFGGIDMAKKVVGTVAPGNVDPTLADLHVEVEEIVEEVTPATHSVESPADETPSAEEVSPAETGEEPTNEVVKVAVHSSLQKRVETRVKARTLSEYIWTMSSMLNAALGDSDKDTAERVESAYEIIDDFAGAVKPLCAELASEGADNLGLLFSESLERTGAQFASARVDAIRKAMDSVLVEFADLECLLTHADVVESTPPKETVADEVSEPSTEDRPNVLKAHVDQQMASLRDELMAKLADMGNREAAFRSLVDTLQEVVSESEQPRGVVSGDVSGGDPATERQSSKEAFLRSISGDE